MQTGVFLVEGKHGKAQEVADAVTLYSLSSVERADMNEAGLATIRDKIVVPMNERNRVVYQLGPL